MLLSDRQEQVLGQNILCRALIRSSITALHQQHLRSLGLGKLLMHSIPAMTTMVMLFFSVDGGTGAASDCRFAMTRRFEVISFLFHNDLEAKYELAAESNKARATQFEPICRTSATLQRTQPSATVDDRHICELTVSNAATGAQSRSCFLNWQVGSC
jgi:hypothetical protein